MFKRGDDIAAEVRSSWCCVDASTRRPRRIADDIARVFLPLASLRHCQAWFYSATLACFCSAVDRRFRTCGY
jgi:acyl-ACP thioesterase